MRKHPSPAPTINPFGYVNPNNGISYVNSANVASVTFSGACSGATVRLYVNGIYVITTGCPSGAWSTTASMVTIPEGDITVQVYDTDLAGNFSVGTRTGVKDTIFPAAPADAACSPNPTSQSMQASWTAPADASGILQYQGQTYTCAAASPVNGTCSSPVAAGSWIRTTPNFSNYSGDGKYSLTIKTVDNANNTGSASALIPTCLSDHTSPTAPVVNTLLSTASPTNSPTPTVAWQPPSDPPTPWREGTVASGVNCVNVSATGPEGSCSLGACVTGTNQWTLPAACHTAQGDGNYTFSLQTRDYAGNVSGVTQRVVAIDTQGPTAGNEITIITDPRSSGGRIYTASTENQIDWVTNSNWPRYSANCFNCEFASMNPQVIWQPSGPNPPTSYLCSQLPGISEGTMYCTYNCLDGIPDPLKACLNVYFDNNPGVGHNGVLTVPLSNVFKDTAGNPAQGTSTLDVFNQPPVITIGGGEQ